MNSIMWFSKDHAAVNDLVRTLDFRKEVLISQLKPALETGILLGKDKRKKITALTKIVKEDLRSMDFSKISPIVGLGRGLGIMYGVIKERIIEVINDELAYFDISSAINKLKKGGFACDNLKVELIFQQSKFANLDIHNRIAALIALC